MRLFVSYARVDKPYCIQIVEMLNVHDVWYDQRLYAGQHWWSEILRRLNWCEGFVYLLSPDSVTSEYCRKEFDLARGLGRSIFPVLIHSQTNIPQELSQLQYADLSKGLTPEAVRVLLNSVYVAERQAQQNAPPVIVTHDEVKPPIIDSTKVIGEAATAMEKGQFDHAVYLLKQAKAKGYKSQYINIDTVLAEAETALERQTYLREAEREYRPIAELIKYKRTRNLGCEAFVAFQKDFPDYDPDCLTEVCKEIAPAQVGAQGGGGITLRVPALPTFNLPLLEWCEVPAGIVTVQTEGVDGKIQRETLYLDSFYLSKYPVTNFQFQAFIDDPNGYGSLRWWNFSPQARAWREKNPDPKPPRFKGDERPRESVTWYEAVAFCNWLSDKTGVKIMLPTTAQWQRAAQGDDNRLYPWGSEFDKDRANTRESQVKMTTIVMRYANGASPFGIVDLAGNVWEWCANGKDEAADSADLTANLERAVCGGSFVSAYQRARTTFHYFLSPLTHYATIGFRIACVP